MALFPLPAVRDWLSVAVMLVWASSASAQYPHVASGLPHGIPDFCRPPTMVSVQAGSWSTPGTWNLGRLPNTTDRVSVRHAVTYGAVSDTPIACVEVDSGASLTFEKTSATRLTVGTLMIQPGGALEVGTPANPVPVLVTAEIVIADQALNTSADPEQFGTGIIGLGKVTMAGALRVPFARLLGEVAIGQTVFSTDRPLAGWRPGDRIWFPDTRHLTDAQRNPYVPQYEELIIASTSGSSVTTTAGARFVHEGARDGNGVLDLLPHVVHVTRNVVVRSVNPMGTRGHVIFATRAEVDLRYASFRELGRTTMQPLNSTTWNGNTPVTIGTNQIGRYALHAHHNMGPLTPPANGHQFTWIGNVVESAKKWGLTVHNTHWGLIQDNVVYGADGAGVMTEDGNESFNVFERNFVGPIRGVGGQGIERGMRDTGWEGTGFWFRGTNNRLRDNIATDAIRDYGFKYMMIELFSIPIPNFPGADTTIPGQFTMTPAASLPIREDLRSEVYGAMLGGLQWWWVGTVNNAVNPTVGWSVVRDAKVWHVHDAAVYNYQANLVWIDGLIVRGKRCDIGSSKAFRGYDYMNRYGLMTRANIQGVTYGYSPTTNSGNGVQVVRDSYFRNCVNYKDDTLWTSDSDARKIQPRKVVFRNVRMDPTPIHHPGVASKYVMHEYQSAPTRALVQRDELFVYEHNGNKADNFRGYWSQQASGFVVPQTQPLSGVPGVIGSPVAGLTNAQTSAQFGVAIAGSVTPCTTTRPLMDGFPCVIPWADPSTDGLPPLPSTTLPSAPIAVGLLTLVH